VNSQTLLRHLEAKLFSSPTLEILPPHDGSSAASLMKPSHVFVATLMQARWNCSMESTLYPYLSQTPACRTMRRATSLPNVLQSLPAIGSVKQSLPTLSSSRSTAPDKYLLMLTTIMMFSYCQPFLLKSNVICFNSCMRFENYWFFNMNSSEILEWN